MRLGDIQTAFVQSMLDQSGATENAPESLTALLSGGKEILPERLNIYRNNIFSGLIDSLLASYPVIVALVGDDFSRALMRAFILENPPQQGCLADYGGGLDIFIANYAAASALPYLADVARMEWAINESYYAPDDNALSSDDLRDFLTGTPTEAVLFLRSCIRLLQSPWPLAKIRDFCLDGEGGNETLDLDSGPCSLMIWRADLDVAVIAVEPDEYAFLQRIQNGSSPDNTIGNILMSILKDFPDFDFQKFLEKHLGHKVFLRKAEKN